MPQELNRQKTSKHKGYQEHQHQATKWMGTILLLSSLPTERDRHPLNGLFLGKPAPERLNQSGTSLKSRFWILLRQEIMGQQWHQLDHTQIICT